MENDEWRITIMHRGREGRGPAFPRDVIQGTRAELHGGQWPLCGLLASFVWPYSCLLSGRD